MQINETIFRDASSTTVALDSEIWLANTGTVHTHPVVPDWSRACWCFASLISRSALATFSSPSINCDPVFTRARLSLSLLSLCFALLSSRSSSSRGIESVAEIAIDQLYRVSRRFHSGFQSWGSWKSRRLRASKNLLLQVEHHACG